MFLLFLCENLSSLFDQTQWSLIHNSYMMITIMMMMMMIVIITSNIVIIIIIIIIIIVIIIITIIMPLLLSALPDNDRWNINHSLRS